MFRLRRTACRVLLLMILGLTGVSHSQAAELAATPLPTGILTNIGDVLRVSGADLTGLTRTATVSGTLTYSQSEGRLFYLQQGSNAVLVVNRSTNANVLPRQQLTVSGRVVGGMWAPYIEAKEIETGAIGEWPKAIAGNVARMAAGEHFGRFVKVRGHVHDQMVTYRTWNLNILSGGQFFGVHYEIPPGFVMPTNLIDAEVEVSGVCWTREDSLRRPTSFSLYGMAPELVTTLRPGLQNPFDRPILRVAKVPSTAMGTGERVHIQGVVSYYSTNGFFYLEDASGPAYARLLVPLFQVDPNGQSTQQPEPVPLQPGDLVDVLGAPSSWGNGVDLKDVVYRRVSSGPAPAPIKVSPLELFDGVGFGQVVTVQGKMVGQDFYRWYSAGSLRIILQAEGQVFSAMIERNSLPQGTPQVGSYLEVTGINFLRRGSSGNLKPMGLLLRKPQDVRVVPAPPFWREPENRRLWRALAVLLCLLAAWLWYQRRQLRRLRASEERFRALIENSFDLTVILNTDASVKYISPSGVRLLGDVTELSRAVHPEDLPRVVEAHTEVLKTPGASKRVADYRLIAKDGTVRFAEAIGTNCLHVPGVEGVVINVRDITERHEAESRVLQAALIQQRINEFASSLSNLHTEMDILWELAGKCISVLGFVDCVIYLLDENRGVLTQCAAYGPKNPRGREILEPLEIRLGQGIVGTVAQSGVAEVIPDTRKDARYIQDDAPRLSEIAVPIMSGGRVMGVIDSEHPSTDFFTREHLEVLSSIASLCAIKLIRARAELRLRELNSELERRIEERTAELRLANDRLQARVEERVRAEKVQTALFQISEAVHAAEDLPSLYERIHSIVGTLMPADNFYLALLDRDSGMVSFPYHKDRIDPPPRTRLSGRGMTEYVLRTGRPTLANWEKIAELKASGDYVQTGHPARIWLGVPLAAQGRTFGVMAVQDHDRADAFGENEKQLLGFVAEQTALAIERKRAASQLKASAEQLRQSEEKFSKAFHASPVILSIARLADGHFVDVNDAFLETLGLKRHEVIGRSGYDIGIWPAPEARESFVAELRVRGSIRNRLFSIRKDGEPRTLLLSAELIHIGEEQCVVAVSLDVTERQQAEAELLRTLARERELSELKSRFVATISHEFRTPLGVILSSADILQRYFHRLPQEQRVEHVRDIQESALGMADQMENALVFGRAEADRLELCSNPVDLPALCRKVIDQLATATDSKCPVRLDCDPEFPTILADGALLHHVVTNLLSNAIKYSQANSPVVCELLTDGSTVTLRIIDRGIGIPPRDQARLFMPFQRGSNTAGVPGTGMGLTIVRRCIELHGGSVSVQSAEGSGTVVAARWPRIASASASTSTSPTRQANTPP